MECFLVLFIANPNVLRCGPIFGAGADLLISSHCNQNTQSYSNLPHSYEGENVSCNTLMGDYNFTVVDYEVFTPYGK